MARNGSGVFTPSAADYPAVASTLIESGKYNNVVDDIATALTGSIAADGQTTITANLPMNNKKLTGLAAGATVGDSVRYEQVVGVYAELAGSATQDFAADNLTVAGAVNEARGSVAMHATTMDLWAQPNIIDGTGSAVTITAIANAPQAGARRVLYPIAATVITDGATFAVDGATNYTTAAGDALEFEAVTTSTYKVHIIKKDGTPVVAAAAASETVSGIIELATIAEVLAGTDTARAVTAAGIAGSKSLDASGYYKFPGGFIVQWGTGTASTGGTANTFPIAFTNACYVVSGNNTSTNDSALIITGKTTTQFTATVAAGAPSINYIAVGK